MSDETTGRGTSWLGVSSVLVAVLGPFTVVLLDIVVHDCDTPFFWVFFTATSAVLLGLVAVLGLRRTANTKTSNWAFALCGIALGSALLYLAVSSYIIDQHSYDQRRCTNNLKQIGAAMEMYVDDWGGKLPQTAKWNESVVTAMKPVFKVRVGTHDGPEQRLRCCSQYERRRSGLPTYAMNPHAAGKRVADMANPWQVPLFFESSAGRDLVGGLELLPRPARHNGFYDVLFCDGHVSMATADELRHASWRPTMKTKRSGQVAHQP